MLENIVGLFNRCGGKRTLLLHFGDPIARYLFDKSKLPIDNHFNKLYSANDAESVDMLHINKLMIDQKHTWIKR